ncbi:hypothetical protein ACFJGV_00565 [Cnuibacter sp. UC19_7]|uniref:hypothetical protein n=1 Tax=Cnuibacter sp. UC19_7 TaxID=3350166 RepID=UPI00366C6FE9
MSDATSNDYEALGITPDGEPERPAAVAVAPAPPQEGAAGPAAGGTPGSTPGGSPGGAPRQPEAYTLTGRDRTALSFVGASLKIGTPEFRARYESAIDDLYRHHFIDPTARPAYEPPAPIDEVESEDPLEIIRSQLGLVFDDRRSRDGAREEAEQRLAQTQATLDDTAARLADTEQRLAATSATLAQREAELADLRTRYDADTAALRAQLEADTTALRDHLAAETARLENQRVTELDALRNEHAATVGRMGDESAARIAALETEVAGLHAAHAATLEATAAEHAALLLATQQEHANASESAAAGYAGEIERLRAEHADALDQLRASHAAELEAEQTTGAARLAEMQGSVDSLRTEYDQKLADLEARHETEVGSMRAGHEAQLQQMRTSHEAQLTALRSSGSSPADAAPADTASADAPVAAPAPVPAISDEDLEGIDSTDLVGSVDAIDPVRASSHVSADAATGMPDPDALDTAKTRIADLEAQLKEARDEIGTLADERDRALSDSAISLEDRERLSDSLVAAQAERGVLIAELEMRLQRARALVSSIEEIATGQLCSEDETNEYAIGANDSAVLVLNAIADSDSDVAA